MRGESNDLREVDRRVERPVYRGGKSANPGPGGCAGDAPRERFYGPRRLYHLFHAGDLADAMAARRAQWKSNRQALHA